MDSANISSILDNVNAVLMLNGTNYKVWKENVKIVLGCMDLDIALRIARFPPLSASSTLDDKRELERWERSNRVSLMIMKRVIPEAFRGNMSEDTDVKTFLEKLEKRFEKNEKAETNTLLTKLISLKYNGKENIRGYIMEISRLASRLKQLELELSEDMLVHLVLISLPPQFGQFKISYNCQKDKLTLNELISHCVQEEERIKHDRTESDHLASSSKDKGKKMKKEAVGAPSQSKQKKSKSF